jgi:hypothetical protein
MKTSVVLQFEVPTALHGLPTDTIVYNHLSKPQLAHFMGYENHEFYKIEPKLILNKT